MTISDYISTLSVVGVGMGFPRGGQIQIFEVILKLHSWHRLFGQYEISYMTSMDCVCILIVMLTTAVQLLRRAMDI